MTLDEFVDKWLGKKADWDGAYGGQCVDLFRFYVDQVFSNPQPKSVKGAANFWENYDSDKNLNNYYEKIPYSSSTNPLRGDVVFWNTNAGGGYGHVAVFLDGSRDSFTSLDQNWPTLSVVTKTKHNNSNVLGYFRKRGVAMDDCQAKLAWYEKEYPLEQDRVKSARRERDDALSENERLRGEMATLKSDFKNERESLIDQNKLEKQRYKEFLAGVAQPLGTTQDEPAIYAQLNRLVGIEDSLTSERRDHASTKDKLREANEIKVSLETEIKNLKEELRAARGLKDASKIELLTELINRLFKIQQGK